MQNEFSRPVAIGALSEEEVHRIEATPAERAAIARRFGLRALDRLDAEVRLAPLGRGIRLEAALDADVVQDCVVSLEPVPSRVTDRFTLVYGEAPAGDEESVVEPLEGDTIDIGEAVAQQLSLALDPYPRAPGAAVEPRWTGEGAADGPFAALAKLKKPGGDTGAGG
jgi:uncharacterized metal-binding protein YceD (DUF177 family)